MVPNDDNIPIVEDDLVFFSYVVPDETNRLNLLAWLMNYPRAGAAGIIRYGEESSGRESTRGGSSD